MLALVNFDFLESITSNLIKGVGKVELWFSELNYWTNSKGIPNFYPPKVAQNEIRQKFLFESF